MENSKIETKGKINNLTSIHNHLNNSSSNNYKSQIKLQVITESEEFIKLDFS